MRSYNEYVTKLELARVVVDDRARIAEHLGGAADQPLLGFEMRNAGGVEPVEQGGASAFDQVGYTLLAPLAFACSSSSMTSIPEASPITNPSRSLS